MIGESLWCLIGQVMVLQKTGSMEQHFGPARAREPGVPVPPGVELAQLGVGIKGGLEELVHAVTIALQSHPFSRPAAPCYRMAPRACPPPPAPTPAAVCLLGAYII